MVYRAIGLMSGSSLDGLDIAYVEFQENGGKWNFEIIQADCYVYSPEWIERLKGATKLNAIDYQILHVDFGHYLGAEVNRFIETHQLQYRVALVGSHGHTSFHLPAQKMTAQLGDGAAIAAVTGLPVVSDLRGMDVALGGQGAPIVPIGEKLLLGNTRYSLNIGGIANISVNTESYRAFDVCPANRVLNLLAMQQGMEYDDGGNLAGAGTRHEELFSQLNALDYYQLAGPKSLANDFGTDVIYPLILGSGCSVRDGLRTYSDHIAFQVKRAIESAQENINPGPQQLLVTGGGAFNTYLINQLQAELTDLNIEVQVPSEKLVKYKEAMIMALIGVLRWREETNVWSSVTGASRDSVGGALWLG